MIRLYQFTKENGQRSVLFPTWTDCEVTHPSSPAVVPDKRAKKRARSGTHSLRKGVTGGLVTPKFRQTPPVAVGPGSRFARPGRQCPRIDSPSQVGEKRGRDDSS